MAMMIPVIGMSLILSLFTVLLPVALLVVLQVWLCKKGKRLGLILPGLSLLLSLLLVFSLGAFQRVGGGSTLIVTDEQGNVIQEEHTPAEDSTVLTPGAVGALAALFFVGNIPTVVFGGIWLHYKNRRDFQEDLRRMKVEDLE